MNCIIPFTKDIKFKTNIGEILSVSLEHEYTANSSEILGNFIITGDYKAHEVSINKDHFEHVLPFSVDLSARIDSDSVDFAVEDFTYEVIDNDTLRVNIEYSINALEAEEQEELFQPVETKEELDDILEEIEQREEPVIEEVRIDNESDILEENQVNEAIKEKKEVEKAHVESEEKEENNDKKEEQIEKIEKEERDIDNETKNTIIDSINDKEDVFVTYNIHIMKETDTIESICIKYNTTQSILGDYNDLNSLAIGDKLIIPKIDE